MGIASKGEPVDLVLREEMNEKHIKNMLNEQLPKYISIEKIEKIEGKKRYIVAISHTIKIVSHFPVEKISELLKASEVKVFRARKNKEINIRPFIKECSAEIHDQHTTIYLTTLITSQGSVSLWEVLSFLSIPINTKYPIDIERTCVDLLEQ